MGMLEQMFNFAQQVLGIKAKQKKGIRPIISTPGGRPDNVLLNGRVLRKSAVVAYNAAPHITREGKEVFSRLPQKQGGGKYQVMVHRAVDRSELRKAVYQAERAARGRYVGPFSCPAKEARV